MEREQELWSQKSGEFTLLLNNVYVYNTDWWGAPAPPLRTVLVIAPTQHAIATRCDWFDYVHVEICARHDWQRWGRALFHEYAGRWQGEELMRWVLRMLVEHRVAVRNSRPQGMSESRWYTEVLQNG